MTGPESSGTAESEGTAAAGKAHVVGLSLVHEVFMGCFTNPFKVNERHSAESMDTTPSPTISSSPSCAGRTEPVHAGAGLKSLRWAVVQGHRGQKRGDVPVSRGVCPAAWRHVRPDSSAASSARPRLSRVLVIV